MPGSFDFDRVIDRRNTASVKWHKCEQDGAIPMGVADMDFQSPPAVLRALQELVDHGVFGYTLPPPALIEIICERLHAKYGWSIEADWIIWLPGVVSGLNAVSRMAGDPGDQVLMATPVYPPFLTAPGNVGRQCVTVPLLQENDSWAFDFEGLEAAITTRTRLFMLCNPHNPVGRVYTRQELERIAELCKKYDLMLCSDEIHCDILLDEDKRHIPTATLDSATADRTVTFMSTSKTFNLAGIGFAFGIIPNPDLRAAFLKATQGLVPHVNALGYTAALTAYQEGEPWLSALLAYLRANADLVEKSIGAIPGLSVSHVEATYLAWIDIRPAGIEDPGQFFARAGVDLWDGAKFGGPGFVRLNFGCPLSRLEEGLKRIQKAMQTLPG
jgi:cystathionine beta-lyase